MIIYCISSSKISTCCIHCAFENSSGNNWPRAVCHPGSETGPCSHSTNRAGFPRHGRPPLLGVLQSCAGTETSPPRCCQPRDGLGLLRVGFGVQDVHSGCVIHVEIACQGYNFHVQNGYKNGASQGRPSRGARMWKEGAQRCLLLGAVCSSHTKHGNEFTRSF